jgi:nicotinic acid phosphoribosyltransferase
MEIETAPLNIKNEKTLTKQNLQNIKQRIKTDFGSPCYIYGTRSWCIHEIQISDREVSKIKFNPIPSVSLCNTRVK